MKKDTLLTRYHPAARSRALVKQYNDTLAEADRVQAMEKDNREERERIIARADLENPDVIRRASDCEIKAAMCAQKRLQLLALLPDIEAEISKELTFLCFVGAHVSNLACAELGKYIHTLLAPVRHDPNAGKNDSDQFALERAEDTIVQRCPANRAFQIHTRWISVTSAEPGVALAEANETLSSFEEFEASLIRFAKFLSEKFAPMPASQEACAALVPAEYRTGKFVPPEDAEPALTMSEATAQAHLVND